MRKYTPLEYVRVLLSATYHSRWFYKNPYRPLDDIKKYQYVRIRNLISHAYETTELYHKKYEQAGVTPNDFERLEDLSKFPTVTKEEIIEHYPKGCVSKRVDPKECILSVSSGSSGKVINILHNPLDTWAYALGRFRILNINKDYFPFDRALYIYTSPYPATSFFGLYRAFFIPTLNSLKDTAQKILKIQPHIISSYPSQMLALREFIDPKRAKKLSLKLISLGSELSTRKQRDSLASYFACPVYDEFSSEELGWIAGECQQKNYHLWEDICFIEILKKDSDDPVGAGGEGEIVGTNLHNFAMPFIRYRQGDIGKISPVNDCHCGRTFRILENFIGRKNDEFVFSSGKKLTSAYLLDVSYSLLLDLKVDILDFCLLQEGKNHVSLEIFPGKDFKKSDIEKIENKLKELFPQDVKFTVVPTHNLYKTATGKRNPIIYLDSVVSKI